MIQVCPTCGSSVGGSLVDHGIAEHGVARPPTVLAVCAALAVAGALCIYETLDTISPLLKLCSTPRSAPWAHMCSSSS